MKQEHNQLREKMDWLIWAAAGIAAVILVIDWIIVIGTNPKKWKGGEKHGGN